MEPPVNLSDYKSTQDLNFQKIFDAIHVGPVTHLDLTRKFGNHALNDDQLSMILHALMKYETLETLNLNGNDVRRRSSHALVELLEKNHITRLELRLNYMGDAATSVIAKALANHKIIKYLSLATNSIGPKGCQALSHLIRVTSLTHLDLMGNNISADGATILAKALKANKSLTHLDLKDTGIGHKGAEAIGSALSGLPLTYLDLSYNRITDSGAKAIANALLNNTTITFLKVGSVPAQLTFHPPYVPPANSGINRDGLLAFSDLISKTPSLTVFSIDWHKRTKPDVLKTFFNALKHNTTITSFCCGSCTVPNNIIEDCFSENRTITNGLGGKSNILMNKFIRTNNVCKKLNASDEERKSIPSELVKESEIEDFIKKARESKSSSN